MNSRFISLFGLSILCWLVLRAGDQLDRGSPQLHLAWQLCSARDAESEIACGNKIALASASISELELIEGISDTLAFRLHDARRRIVARAKELPSERRYEAFMLLHGVGKKIAQRLEAALSLAFPEK